MAGYFSVWGKAFQAEGLADAMAQRWGMSEDAYPRRQEEGLPWWSSGQDCSPSAGGLGSIPSQGTKILHAATKDPEHCDYRPKAVK